MTGPLVARYTGVHEWMPHQSGPETGLVTLMTKYDDKVLGYDQPSRGSGLPLWTAGRAARRLQKIPVHSQRLRLLRQRKLIGYSMLTLRRECGSVLRPPRGTSEHGDRVFFRTSFRSTGSSAISALE